MNPDPSEGAVNSCNRSCHAADVPYYANSVHATQAGYIELLERRSGYDLSNWEEDHPDIKAGFDMHCGSCHASCGDCHISSPKNVGGGLVKRHKVNRTPDMTQNCTACHGSRVGDEYRGANDYAGGDVHYTQNAMRCEGCHYAEEMHGDETVPTHRYEVASMPACTDCHLVFEDQTPNPWHERHLGDMSCQVCHSQTYKSCNGCHVGEGITGSSYPTFKIGRNPIPELRDAPLVLLRHIPVSPDTFEGWGLETLEEYDSVPTWKYASPHNIRLRTAQTDDSDGKTCREVCHGTSDGVEGLFLRQADLDALPEEERAANAHLIVPDGSPPSWDLD